MNTETRDERLAADLDSLRRLKRVSSVFDFESTGTPPSKYVLVFRGRGLGRETSLRGEVELIGLHRVEIRLPASYPRTPPDVRWLTPLLHPNLSYGGFVSLADIGLPWQCDLGLDVLCERLWDVARMAYIDMGRVVNHSAKSWLDRQRHERLPLDPRPLRDKRTEGAENTMRRTGQASPLPPERPSEEVLYIGEDTPTPTVPIRVVSPRRARNDNDVLYIGDD